MLLSSVSIDELKIKCIHTFVPVILSLDIFI